ncbi:hypothetical protein [Perlabentimonas gracilis]|uniref:hypothetical protein n=1 Tax=Perlabentimonas gracilis TaxID=2715279 RepID=UPI00140A6474|nr:hypothetical protein [Perlabentimonas gracilis]NHB67954.1 hypothetical protein [Perlabentimonas gracilis]
MRIPVEVKVSPIVREWTVCYYGSHVIVPRYESHFGWLLKMVLELPPVDYKFRKLPEQECITFLLPNGKIGENRNFNVYRNFLSPMGHHFISRTLYFNFKSIFHNFMVGAIQSGAKTQKEAIEDFCIVYNLPLKHISYDMLRRSWDRSEEKKFLRIT